MRTVALITFILFISSCVFGQKTPTKILEYRWSGQKGDWELKNSYEATYGIDKRLKQTVEVQKYVENEELHLGRLRVRKFGDNENLISESDSLRTAYGFIRTRREIHYDEGRKKWEETFVKLDNHPERKRREIRYDYDERGNLKQIEKDTLRDFWDLNYHVQYFEYDDNNFLVEKFNKIGNIVPRKTLYFNNENGEVEFEESYWIDERDGKENLSAATYYYRDTLGAEIFERDSTFTVTSSIDPELKYQKAKITQFDSNLNILSKLYTFKLTWDYLYEYKYDEFGNLTQYRSTRGNLQGDPWILLKEEGYELEYDDNGFLVRQTLRSEGNHYSYNFEEESHFDNYCDGHPKFVNSYLKGGLQIPNLTYFEYLEGSDCKDNREIEHAIDVFPNPSSGIFRLESDVLEGQSSKIYVMDLVGKFLLQKEISIQTYQYDLDLSHLPNGNYLLHLQNGNQYATEKITIFK